MKTPLPSKLAKRIIPCLDVRDGRTVKGVKFTNLVDAGNPVELAARYAEEGADELIFLDITATLEQRKTQAALAREVAKEINIPFTIGGGIRSVQDAGELLYAGADKVTVNSAALRSPSIIDDMAKSFGSQFIVLAIDAKEMNGGWAVFCQGGRLMTERSLLEWALEGQERGAGEILFTSMDHDGSRNGFAIGPLRSLAQLLTIPVIASGGAGKAEHFLHAFLMGLSDAAVAASLFHFGELSIPELKIFLNQNGISIR